jgi:glutamyl-tRNA reductase
MSNVAILSVNHQLASVAIREKVAFAPHHISTELKKLKAIKGVRACAILSTCNRSEIYVSSEFDAQALLSNYLCETHNLQHAELAPYLVYFKNNNALNHICQVATGLDSLVLGEPQILGQLKDAYHTAKKANTLDKILEKLFQHAFSTAKKVRTDTQIGASPVSIAYCAIKLGEKIFTDLSAQTVLLIGAGEMIELCAQHLHQKGVKNMIVANRTVANAEKIAKLYQAKSISLKQFSTVIHQADIIISSTAASVPIIGKGLIESALKKRQHKSMFLLDIAMPRDIEPEVSQLEEAYLYTIDDLQQVVAGNISSREKEKTLAQDIIIKQNQVFNQWVEALPNENLIKSYKNNAEKIKQSMLKKAIKSLKNGTSSEAVLTKLADQLTNKLLHSNFKNIKRAPNETLMQCKNCIPNLKK